MIVLSTSFLVIFGRIAILPIILLGAGFHAYRVYQNNDRIGIAVIKKLLLSILLLLASSILAIVVMSTHFWVAQLLGSACFLYSVLVAYFVAKQYLSNELEQESIIKTKLFRVITVIIILKSIIEYIRRDNMYSFMDNEEYIPTASFYLANLFHYGVSLFLFWIILRLYWQDIRKSKNNIAHILRRSVTMAGFGVAFVCYICLTAAMLLTMFVTDNYQVALNDTYHIGKPIIMILLLLGLTVPKQVFSWCVRPLERVLARRELHRYEALHYLLMRLVQVVPMVHLEHQDERLRNRKMPLRRILGEISDARRIIWSWNPDIPSFDAQAEARHIFSLLQDQQLIEDIGTFTPPPAPADLFAYNLLVAKHLKRLEQQSAALVGSNVPV